MNEILSRWKDGLARTSQATFRKLVGIFGATELTPQVWETIEAQLLQADVGIITTLSIIKSLKEKASAQGIIQSFDLRSLLESELLSRIDEAPAFEIQTKPSIILVVGVNGSGKTTTVAKLGYNFTKRGKTVLLVAADTFRAAAVDQMGIWAERLKLPIVSGQMGSDPSAVVYDGIQSAISKQYEVVLIDTAGRLHTRSNLMDELNKINRVAGKAIEGAPHAVWLVLDATTGQNAIIQARAFKEAVDVTGLILAKLDSSARGGMAFAIQHELGIPILFAGLGEKIDDLALFNPRAFVDGILAE